MYNIVQYNRKVFPTYFSFYFAPTEKVPQKEKFIGFYLKRKTV